MPIRTSHPMYRLFLAVMAFSLGITLDGAPQALAQGAALEEVIVTARKRDENLMGRQMARLHCREMRGERPGQRVLYAHEETA